MPTSSLDFLIHIFCGLVPAGCAAASVTWGWVVSVCDRLCPMGAEQHLCINCWCGLDRVRCPGGGSLHPRGPRLPLDGWWHLGRPILITDAFLPGISGAPVFLLYAFCDGAAAVILLLDRLLHGIHAIRAGHHLCD